MEQKIIDDEIEKLQSNLETMEEKLNRIRQWCEVYPLGVFPEPDMERVRRALEAVGITIDSVSASNMRHVVQGIQKIINGDSAQPKRCIIK